jgi:hypothetical protein
LALYYIKNREYGKYHRDYTILAREKRWKAHFKWGYSDNEYVANPLWCKENGKNGDNVLEQSLFLYSAGGIGWLIS